MKVLKGEVLKMTETEIGGLKVSVPSRETEPLEDLNPGRSFMTDNGHKKFPEHDSPTTRPFCGVPQDKRLKKPL